MIYNLQEAYPTDFPKTIWNSYFQLILYFNLIWYTSIGKNEQINYIFLWITTSNEILQNVFSRKTFQLMKKLWTIVFMNCYTNFFHHNSSTLLIRLRLSYLCSICICIDQNSHLNVKATAIFVIVYYHKFVNYANFREAIKRLFL